jgi:hypothetical protein
MSNRRLATRVNSRINKEGLGPSVMRDIGTTVRGTAYELDGRVPLSYRPSLAWLLRHAKAYMSKCL